MKQRLCRVCQRWHALDEWPAACMRVVYTRSHLSAPQVITDTMTPVKSMLDGKLYDSKAALRATYRAAGVTEVGNETPKPFVKPKPDRQAIKAAVGRAWSQAGLGA